MSDLSQNNVQTSTESTTQSLLATLKASLGLGNGVKGGLFESLLAETNTSLPQVKANDSMPLSAAASDVARQSVARANEKKSSHNQIEDRASSPKPKADQREAAQDASDMNTATTQADEAACCCKKADKSESCIKSEKMKKARESGEAEEAEDVDEDDAEASLIGADPSLTALSLDMSTTDQTVEGDLLGNEAVVTQPQDVVSADPLGDAVQQTALAAAAQSNLQSESAPTQSEATQTAASVGMNGPALNSALSKTDTTSGGTEQALTQTQGDLPADTSSNQAGSGNREDQTTFSASVSKDASDSTLAPTANNEMPARGVEQSFLDRGFVPPAQGLAASNALAKASPNAAVQELASVSEASGASAAKTTGPVVLGEGVRPSGSYTFASQLSATRATQGGSVGLPKAVEQVAVQLHKMVKEGSDQMTIQLKPVELGKIEIKLEFSADNKVQGTVVADNQATLNLLLKDVGGLQRALQDAGLQADANSLQFSLRGDGQGQSFAQTSKEQRSQTMLFATTEGEPEDALTLTGVEAAYLAPGRVNLRV